MLHHREGQVVAACPSCHLKEVIMTIINLNRYYYPQCHRNALIEVPDEVAEILERGQRAEHNQESKAPPLKTTLPTLLCPRRKCFSGIWTPPLMPCCWLDWMRLYPGSPPPRRGGFMPGMF